MRALAREGRKLAAKIKENRTAVRDRSRSIGRKLRSLTRTIRKRTGEAKREVLVLTEQTGELLLASITEARRLVATARRRAARSWCAGQAEGRQGVGGARRPLREGAGQIKQRVAGEPITDRLISLWDTDARPIRKGKLGKPTEFGYVDQLCEITANTKRGARGFVLPPKSQTGTRRRTRCCPTPRPRLKNLNITLKEIVLDGGFMPTPTNTTLEDLADTIHIAGRQESGSRRTRRRRQRYHTGAEGRISHLKRGYGLRRSRLKGDTGHQIWTGWATLSYNARDATPLSNNTEDPEPGDGTPAPEPTKQEIRTEPAPAVTASTIDDRRPFSTLLTAPPSLWRVDGRRLGRAAIEPDWRRFPPAATSNRACGSPAHGSPTFFTAGIRLSLARPDGVWARRRFQRG